MTPSLASSRLRVLALVTAFALTACSGKAVPPARVAGADITQAELRTAAGVITSLAGIQQLPCGQKTGEGDTDEAACNRFALGALIQLRLASDYAEANGVTVNDRDVETAIEDFEAAVGASDFEAELGSNGVTHDDFVGFVRASLLQDQVARALTEEELGEDGLREIYEGRLTDFTVVEVDHILVASEEDARDVYEKVTAPGATREDFLALAAEVSLDPSAEDNSGAIPPTPAGQFVPEFAQAAVALEEGEISEPVQSEFGWHVIHLVSKEVTPFEDVKDSLVAGEMTEIFAGWVRDRLDEGSIEVDPAFGRFDPDLLTVVRITSTDPSATEAPAPANAVPEG